jgi:hypothetical protein
MKGAKEMLRAKSTGSDTNRMMMVGLLVVLVMSAGFVLVASSPALADTTFTVRFTGDQPDFSGSDGRCDTDSTPFNGLQCTLRAAIQQANATPGADTINFNIQSIGVMTISPASGLPQISDTVTIDGYSQLGSSVNTLAKGTNAILKIQLNGGSVDGFPDGLRFGPGASDSVVKGLVINRFGGDGIDMVDARGMRIEGNFIGTDPSGTLDLGNGTFGVLVNGDSNSNTVGGTLRFQRNLISGNLGGIVLNSNADSNEVQGNLIGTNKDGTLDLGNDFAGVDVRGVDNFIGDFSQSGANTIAFNGRDGVVIGPDTGGVGNRILSNSIFSNDRLGINLRGGTENAAGATANDPKDPDTGPNDLQNKPVITSAVTSGGTTTIQGKLNSTPNEGFLIEFFSSPSGNEGTTLIDETTVRTNSNGNATFSVTPSQAVPAGQKVTATALHVVDGNSSEFSGARTVVSQ